MKNKTGFLIALFLFGIALGFSQEEPKEFIQEIAELDLQVGTFCYLQLFHVAIQMNTTRKKNSIKHP